MGAVATLPHVATDTFVQKTRKLYADSRAPRNVSKLASELAEVRAIVTRSVADVLGAGERLESVSAASAQLRTESARYAAKSKALSRQALFRKLLCPIVVLFCVVFLLVVFRAVKR